MEKICESCGRDDLPIIVVVISLKEKSKMLGKTTMMICKDCLEDSDERTIH